MSHKTETRLVGVLSHHKVPREPFCRKRPADSSARQEISRQARFCSQLQLHDNREQVYVLPLFILLPLSWLTRSGKAREPACADVSPTDTPHLPWFSGRDQPLTPPFVFSIAYVSIPWCLVLERRCLVELISVRRRSILET